MKDFDFGETIERATTSEESDTEAIVPIHKNAKKASGLIQLNDFDFGETIERATTSEESDTEAIVPIHKNMSKKYASLAQHRGLEDGEDVVERATHSEEDDTEKITPVKSTT